MSQVTIPDAMSLALTHHNAGRLAEAEAIYRQILAADPRHADALHNLGVIANQTGHLVHAKELIAQAIAIAPNEVAYHCNLGETYRVAGQLAESIPHYRRALELQPDHPAALCNLGLALDTQGNSAEAVPLLERALELKADFQEAHLNLGGALHTLGRNEEAFRHLERATILQPQSAESWSTLGICLVALRRRAEAERALLRAIEIKPGMADAHQNLALLRLAWGDYAGAWPEYEWRWFGTGHPAKERRDFRAPQWKGEPFAGRSLLLHAEQGYGDTLQMVRYLPQVAALGGRILLETAAPLASLLRPLPEVAQWVARGEPLPPHDLHCPLMSLPLAFNTRAETIPSRIPYLSADPAKVEAWRARLEPEGSARKIGLVWAGSTTHGSDALRSMPLEVLAGPLLKLEGVRFFSLQKGEASAQARAFPALTDYTEELEDFGDTAALIMNLDLVIAVDTSVIHLTGALGKPVWTLIPHTADWRWLVEGDTSAWYPTMRLFRQDQPNDWPSVVQRVAEEVRIMK